MDSCGHYAHWEEDFRLVKELGLDALRYAPAYYRVHTEPDYFDWEVADEPLLRLRELGIEVIADLCRFGVPSWLGGFQDEAFPVLFANYARAFAKRYPWIRYFTPVHEILVCASASALYGRWNECLTSERAFACALRNLCLAHELAVEAILAECPDAIIVQSESLEYVHATDGEVTPEVEQGNGVTSLALDLTLGHALAPGMARFLHEHGVTASDLSFFRERRAAGQRWLGLNSYVTGEHGVSSARRGATVRPPREFAELATHYHTRYQLPLVHCGTHWTSSCAVEWLRQQWDVVQSLRRSGIPVTGFTWYAFTDQIDWPDTLHTTHGHEHSVGLYDLTRQIRPVGDAYRAIITEARAVDGGVRKLA